MTKTTLSLVTLSALWMSSCGSDPGPGPIPPAPVPVEPVEAVYHPEKSAARNWNEALLAAIRIDFARPPVHARNLFHSSAVMYDLWSVFDAQALPYFLGRAVATGDGAASQCAFSPMQRLALQQSSVNPNAERSRAIAYAMHRLLSHRFAASPGAARSQGRFNKLLREMGFEVGFASRNFSAGTQEQKMAALGLYVADCVIAHGLRDGANESAKYANQFYTSVNAPLFPSQPESADMADPDRWQPLSLSQAIDQSGQNVANQPPFMAAEWGKVAPFALPAQARINFERNAAVWPVYHDPGPPARLRGEGALPQEYKWNHAMVALWSSHLDPADGVLWDISPGAMGSTDALPESMPAMRDFYDAENGGVRHHGYTINPRTGQPYAPNVVPRGDYTRVLAEYWADGPQSETPPGHWFTILNKMVSDHPQVQKRYRGQGPVLDDLEWDVKSYFALGGAVHDAAITAWGIKGWYDYVRPISAIRCMAFRGQSSNPELPNYHPEGLPLIPGFIEMVTAGDPLAGPMNANVGKAKIKAWRGPGGVTNPKIEVAGVAWILAETWVPFQRATFVTPPFAGYVSGHSTFSRAAAEVLTDFTGDAYFPGGMAEDVVKKDTFLPTERGPSVDVALQWATYRDASDQTSLSRIWGGIHPPVDDIPGRRLGIRVAHDATTMAHQFFTGVAP